MMKGRSASSALWLGLYFLLNLALTLYNKLVLIHFPFPYTLTALHALCGSIGSFLLLHLHQASRRSQPNAGSIHSRNSNESSIPNPQGKELLVILLFSTLYTLNIIISNASLRLVTVPFHQCLRASAPLFVIALSSLLFRKSTSRAKLLSLVPVVLGVCLATYGDYYFTKRGFVLTLLGTLLAALKTIVTNVLQMPGRRHLTAPGTLPHAHIHHNAHVDTHHTHSQTLKPHLPRSSAEPGASTFPHALGADSEETCLYPPLSPRGSFHLPSRSPPPSPSQPHSPIPISTTTSSAPSSSSSSSDKDRYRSTNGYLRPRPRPLSVSSALHAFNPGPIDDSAPSIPLPPLYPTPPLSAPPTRASTFAASASFPSKSASLHASPSQYTNGCGSSPSSYPICACGTKGIGRANGHATSTATEPFSPTATSRSSATTPRPPKSPPSFYKHHLHAPSSSTSQSPMYTPFALDGYGGSGGGWSNGKHNGNGNRNDGEWKMHRSTPSRLLASASAHLKSAVHRNLRIRRLRSFSLSEAWRNLDLPKLSLTPLQLLYLLSPLAFIQTTLLAHFTGELEAVNIHLHNLARSNMMGAKGISTTWTVAALGTNQGVVGPRTWLFLNGVLAFALNVVSFNANRRVGAVGMSVAANTKQALAVLCSITLFNLTLSSTNALGIALALFGGGWYAWVEVNEKNTGTRGTKMCEGKETWDENAGAKRNGYGEKGMGTWGKV